MPQIDFQPATDATLAPSEALSPESKGLSFSSKGPTIDFQPVGAGTSKPGKKPEVGADKPNLSNKSKDVNDTFTSSQTAPSAPGPKRGIPPVTMDQFRTDPIGAAFRSQIEGANKPIIDFTAIGGEKHIPGQSFAAKAARGVTKSAESFASGLTTPKNIALLVGTWGLGGAEASAAIKVANRLIASGFGIDMLWNAAKQTPELIHQIKKGDVEGAASTLTDMGLSGGLGALSLRHGVKGGGKTAQESVERAEAKTGGETSSGTPEPAPRAPLGEQRVDFKADQLSDSGGQLETVKHSDQFAKKSRLPAGPVTYGFGLGALGEMDLSTPESDALAAQRKATLEALEQAKATPEQSNLAEKLRSQLTGVREFIRTWTNQKMLDLKARVLKDHVDREALTLLRDFKDKPGELQQFFDGTHPWLQNDAITKRLIEDKPDATVDDIRKAQLMVVEAMAKMKPVIERALNPSAAMLKADPQLTRMAEQFLAMGKAKGILDSSISPETYAPHMINPGDGLAGEGGFDPANYQAINERGKLVAGKIARKFGFAQQRNYPTMLHAIADGLKPRTLDIIDAFTIYGDKFASAFATRDWEEAVHDTGLGLWTTRGQAPDGWRPIAEHSPLFTKRATFPIRGEDTTKTEHATVEYRFYVPPYIEEAMRPITDPNYMDRIKGWRLIRGWQGFTKTANLAWSVFHPKAETIMGFNSMGPRDFARGLRIDRNSDDFLAGQRRLAFYGGENLGDVAGRTFEAYRALKPSSIPTQVDIWKAKKGFRELDKITEGFTHFTFDTIAGKFKVVDFMLKESAFRATHPNATTAELDAHLRGVAQYLNNVYGGINWENRGWNQASVQISRGIIMAPDWVYSNFFGLYDAATDWKTSSGRLSRAFWMRAITTGIASTVAASVMFQGKKFFQVVDEDKKNIRRALTEVYMGDDSQGNHIWRPLFFAGAQSDLVNTINKMADDGPLTGLAEEMRNKTAPGLRTLPSIALNKTYTGSEISDREEPWLTQARRQTGFAIGDALPVPFWILTAKDMLFGPDSYKYSAGEVAETMLLASPAHHARPTGTPEEEAKRRAKASAGHFVQSPEGLERAGKSKDWVRRIKAGDAAVTAEIDAEVDAGRMTPRQRTNLYKLGAR